MNENRPFLVPTAEFSKFDDMLSALSTNKATQAEVNDIVNVLGAKNLTPSKEISQTKSEVTCNPAIQLLGVCVCVCVCVYINMDGPGRYNAQ